jgi:predicted nucleotidyltransferase
MTAKSIPAEATDALVLVRELFGDSLLAVYLHGSAATSALRPQSDVDLLVVTGRPMPGGLRRDLLAALLRISGRYPIETGAPHCLEVMVFATDDLATATYPISCEFIYGEWLRGEFEAGVRPEPFLSPGSTLSLAQARQEAVPLFGPPAVNLLPDVPFAEVRTAMREALPALMGDLVGDERNVLLTLARMWRTAARRDFVSKDVAADWVAPQAPPEIAAVLTLARDAYLGTASYDWTSQRDEARRAADYLHQHVLALVTA